MAILNARKKAIGRPKVDSEEVSVRIEREQLQQIDKWRMLQGDNPGRPEAIRRLLAQAFRYC